MSKKKKVMLGLIGLLFVAALICFFGLKMQRDKIHREGVIVEEPKIGNERYEGWNDFHYMISDESWSDQKTGNTGKTIAQNGDFLCCLCNVMSMADTKTEKSPKYTPEKINAILSELDGYEEDGTIRRDVLKEIARNVTIHDKIDSRLQENGLVRDPGETEVVYDIVRVKKGEESRWVVVTGLSEDKKQYQCIDPRESAVTTLSDYGNRVYDWYTVGGLQNINIEKGTQDILVERKSVAARNKLIYRIGGIVLLLMLSCIIGGKAERYRKKQKE